MPHLQFEFSFNADSESKRKFSSKIMEHFSEIMDTGTDHIGITIREFKNNGLFMGRVKNTDERIAFVNADIREGRLYEQRRKLALAFMKEINEFFNVPLANMYVIFTEHKGEDFHLYERALKSWREGEDPLKD
ncbi:tautomerase family protein [Flexistipes sinusarabici]|uniref:tautomerase family protein n=1 Tax=Flexistipes sinusarabici TaxID=2352 RepID=UPI002356A7B9|nr:tautomerase [Flexistipes sinusarabici]